MINPYVKEHKFLRRFLTCEADCSFDFFYFILRLYLGCSVYLYINRRLFFPDIMPFAKRLC